MSGVQFMTELPASALASPCFAWKHCLAGKKPLLLLPKFAFSSRGKKMANSFRIWILPKSVTLKGPNRVLLIKTVTHPTLPAALQKNCSSWRHTGPPKPVLIIDSGRVVHVLWGTICWSLDVSC